MEKIKSFFENLYNHFNSRNIEGVLMHTTEDVQWANGMEGGYVYGHDGLTDYWTRQFTLINPKVTPYDIHADGDIATIKVHQIVHDLDGQQLMDKKLYHHFRMLRDKISKFDIGEELTD